MKMLVGVITHSGEDTEIRLAGMVDEAGWTRGKLAVDFKGWPCESRVLRLFVGELVQSEEVDVFALSYLRLVSADVGFFGSDDFADVLVYIFAFSDEEN